MPVLSHSSSVTILSEVRTERTSTMSETHQTSIKTNGPRPCYPPRPQRSSGLSDDQDDDDYKRMSSQSMPRASGMHAWFSQKAYPRSHDSLQTTIMRRQRTMMADEGYHFSPRSNEMSVASTDRAVAQEVFLTPRAPADCARGFEGRWCPGEVICWALRSRSQSLPVHNR